MHRRRPEGLVLAVDLGTSSVRTALFDEIAQRIAGSNASQTYHVRHSPIMARSSIRPFCCAQRKAACAKRAA